MDTSHEKSLFAALRELPSVDHVLHHPAIAALLDEQPRGEVVAAVRTVLDERRAAVRAGGTAALDLPSLALEVRLVLRRRGRSNLRRVVNATGVVLHTGLGRAPLADEAIEAIASVARGYSNLELDLETGERGDRHAHLQGLLVELTGAEDALIVNNNAAATYLALNTLAGGKGAVVSRGQLVEIGGSYRMPDIIAAAGCRMIEVGTTNRTRVGDYERAIDRDTTVLLRVHTSNYRVQGFVESVELAALVDLARRHENRLLVIDDLGSGLIDSFSPDETADARNVGGQWGEPTVRESVRAGADLTLFSGDKLLGGPQAGIIVGRKALLDRLRRNPLMRTYRPDKLTLAALEATLRLYRDPANLVARVPAMRMLRTTPAALEASARQLAERIGQLELPIRADAEPNHSFAGGGTLPTVAFESWVVALRFDQWSAQDVAAALRERDTPIVGRLHEGALLLDVRTLLEDDEDQILAALAEIGQELPSR